MSDLEAEAAVSLSDLVDGVRPIVRSPSREMLAAEKRRRQAEAAAKRKRQAEKRARAESRRQQKRGKTRRRKGHQP